MASPGIDEMTDDEEKVPVTWIHSMHGMPWTVEKMNEAVKILRPGATVSFAFGGERLQALQELNDLVFKPRPDLILHGWSVAGDRMITDRELNTLATMSSINGLRLNGFSNTSFAQISRMSQLGTLRLGPLKKLDISFLEHLKQLKEVRLSGKFDSLEPLETCAGAESLSLSTTIRSFDFCRPLNNLKKLQIDACRASNDFLAFNKPTLRELSITSIHRLENVDALSAFERLGRLKLYASRVEFLPDMKRLRKLANLDLGYMKSWKNPEALKSLPALKELRLTWINTKIKAEQFFFLMDSQTLKSVDFQFMDTNKTRIASLNKAFEARGKAGLLAK
jgi:hypothetical protein